MFLDSLRIRGLDLDMGTDVWLRSNEANIQLTGTVALSKERSSYLLSGTLQAPRGRPKNVIPTGRLSAVNPAGTVIDEA